MINRRLSLAAVLALTLAGCSAPTTVTPPADTAQQREMDRMQRVEQLLNEAERAAPIQAARLKAEAATLLSEIGRDFDAQRLLDQIDTRLLPPSLNWQIALLRAERALQAQQPDQALKYLALPTTAPLPADSETRLSELRLQAYSQKQDPLGETLELIRLSRLQPDGEIPFRDRIWSSLSQLSSEQVSQLTERSSNNYYEQGWFELAYALHQARDLSQQSSALNRWRTLWESHPANQQPPSALQALQAGSTNIQHIALLLPQSGPLAKPARAIREGVMTAYYQAQDNGEPVPRLSMLDASQISSPIQLIEVIQQQQIDLVIGPLDKDYVQQLSLAGQLPAPVLALNYATDDTNTAQTNQLYQFGLAAEDEARQAAERAWQDGHRKIAVLTANSGWGQRVAAAFDERFRALGGIVTTHDQFGDDDSFNTTVSRLMATDMSKKRADRIRQLVRDHKVHFEERRRQDLDAVFLSALPGDARQIKPTLSFHYANDLPIYATSHVYAGFNNPMTDQDLSGIRFVDIPWNLASPSAGKRALQQLRQDTDTRFGRLYALGLDAYQLHPYLQQLAALPQAALQGETGRLSVDNQGRVARQLDWAIFRNGLPQSWQPEQR
ncbi:penicillin-binding protein activator [Marinobacterium arenosum]|uniref:penicillin-binding protein activator n=1 Tax=Marinobacterium arenosum TaxID=2862496 RepID=UPI001C970795|nr:penicillin-binding protein activator [Marinobacterium arenosum]MBY4676609.1 penicillin-binding protein activator [Marinobacterium arenosum]